MVTGWKPFTGDSRPAILTKFVHEAPAPLDHRGLGKLILRYLRKAPARRHRHRTDWKVARENVVEESARASW